MDTTTPVSHEKASKDRYNAMQARLDNHDNPVYEADIKLLVTELDTQLKLEDFLLKSRQADHAKMTVWGPMLVSCLSVLLSIMAVIISLLRQHQS